MFTVQIVNKYKSVPQAYTIYCGRGSALGNPYVAKDRTQSERDRVCELYKDTFVSRMKESQSMKDQLNLIWNTGRRNGIVELQCYCYPRRCHCETIKDIIMNKQVELGR